jgi:hypothetical protein
MTSVEHRFSGLHLIGGAPARAPAGTASPAPPAKALHRASIPAWCPANATRGERPHPISTGSPRPAATSYTPGTAPPNRRRRGNRRERSDQLPLRHAPPQEAAQQNRPARQDCRRLLGAWPRERRASARKQVERQGALHPQRRVYIRSPPTDETT